jgi:hypothetical protein
LLPVLVVLPAMAQQADPRLLGETCAVIAQQRNSLADTAAVTEARRKLDADESAKLKQRLTDWEAYFRAYLGAVGAN